ncbi:MAG: ribosome small subunit-dependent GTPase A [Anaerolineales bacterium]|nr:ribosome small subunit-dependent GTPase A [Anaerolineales bacterium]
MRTAEGDFISIIPGRLKKERLETDIVAAGDRVTISVQHDMNLIEAVAERKSTLARARPSARVRNLSSDREQVLVANPDQLVFVFAVKNPSPNLRKLDRFLVVAEMNQLPAVICVNKVDLTGLEQARQQFQMYADIGYEVIYTSARQDVGITALLDCLQGKLSVLTGSSGVGKSSLLNALQPGLGLHVRDVSEATGKGMHTTRHTELFPLDVGGYVADTPGIRGLALFDVEPTELDGYFREIAPLVPDCQFNDCTHEHEPGCAVIAAVRNGRIHPDRYQSYLRLRAEHEKLDDALY